MGLKLMVTELDARDTKISGSIEVRDGIVADAYFRFLDVVLGQPATVAILTWGFSDAHSWLDRFDPRNDGQMVRGSPYDQNMRRKLAWYAMALAIDEAVPRPIS